MINIGSVSFYIVLVATMATHGMVSSIADDSQDDSLLAQNEHLLRESLDKLINKRYNDDDDEYLSLGARGSQYILILYDRISC